MSTRIEVIEREFFPILNVALISQGLLKCHLKEQYNDNSSILLLKENVEDKFEFHFPRDDLMVATALLDFGTFKILEIDEHRNLFDGLLTRRESWFKMAKPLVLAADIRYFITYHVKRLCAIKVV